MFISHGQHLESGVDVLSVHVTESCLMKCTSETVYETLVTDVLSTKCACQHE